MSDENATRSAEGTESAETATVKAETDWKAEARKWEQRSKENFSKLQELEPLAKRAQELEDAAKSDLQKLQEKWEAANSRATALESERDRLAVIAKHQIPEDYADLVQGNDPESLSASAEKVRALIEKSAKREQGGYVVPAEGGAPALALNGDGIESALKNALGISA